MWTWQVILCTFLATSPRRLRAQSECQREETLKGYKLTGQSFLQYKTHDIWKCFLQCEEDPQCQSINYNLESSLCEQNNRTRTARPYHYIPSAGTVYFDNPLRGWYKKIVTRNLQWATFREVFLKGAVSSIIPSAPKRSSRHFIFHRKYVCFE